MKPTKLLLMLLLLLPCVAFSQNTIRKNMANRYFGYLDYSKAAPIYDELAEITLKKGAKGKAVDWEMVRKAARSNYYMRNYAKAAHWYSYLTAGKAAQKEDYLLYFEALRYTGNYHLAAAFLDSLHRIDPADAKVKEYLRQANYFLFLKSDSARFAIQEMAFNRGYGDFAPAFYGNGFMYASTRRKGTLNREYGWDNTAFLDVYYSEGPTDKAPKKGKLQRKPFRTTAHDGPVYYNKSNETAYLTRNRSEREPRNKGETVQINLYITQKGSRGKWGVPQAFQYNGKGYSTGHAALSPDENTLYFVSDMPGGMGGVDIWKSEKQAGGWAAPVNLGPEINTPDDEMFPYVSPEGHLYFASKGYVGLGGFDVFESRLAGNGLMAPTNLGYPVNTQYDDFALIGRNGGKQGYFSSDRGDYVDRIYSVDMSKRLLFTLEVGVFTAGVEKLRIPGGKIVLYNLTLGDSIVATANDSGQFYAPLLAGCNYKVTASKKGYYPLQPATLSTQGLTESQTLTAELFLTTGTDTVPTGKGLLVIRVSDCETGARLTGLSLVLKDLETGVESRVKTDANGEITMRQPMRELPVAREFAVINEALDMTNDGKTYLQAVKKVYFIMRGDEPGNTITKEICLNQLKEGDLLVLNDIYYDYDKATLRPESKDRLDRAYEYLLRNPGIKLELSSHTDSRAGNAYNSDLSQRRAQSCVNYLVKVKHIPAGRIVAKGYGETRLTNQCADGVPCSEEEHQLNRRTEVRVLKTN